MQCPRAVRVYRQRFARLPNRLFNKRGIRFISSLLRMDPSPHRDFVGTEVNGVAASGLRSLSRLNLRFDSGNDGSSNLLLYREDVFKHAIVAFRPDVIAGERVDQLASDTNSVRRPADAPLKHVADAKFLAHLLDVGRFASIREGRVSGDHEEGMRARQLCNDVFCDAIAEIVLL